jgi:hypothetical protein
VDIVFPKVEGPNCVSFLSCAGRDLHCELDRKSKGVQRFCSGGSSILVTQKVT